jgi:hypothetical protein
MKYFAWGALFIISLLFFSCATSEKITTPSSTETQKISTTTEKSDPITEIEQTPPVTPQQVQTETPKEPIMPPKKNDVIKAEDQSTEITQEEYAKTFEEVEKVIDELNSIIKAGDFSRWTTYLTSKFNQEVMDPKVLEKINEQPILKRNRIIIKTLSDYFMYVVVPSRASVRLDDLIFTDANRVRAFMLIRGDRVLIYQLEKIAGKWKISTW